MKSMALTREQVEAVYDQGKEAMVALILGLAEQVVALQEENAALKARLGKDSSNSHRPPSSDGMRRRTVSNREASGRTKGGQVGHKGSTLMQTAEADLVMVHRPAQCSGCKAALAELDGEVTERRQVWDLPPLRLMVTEHQRHSVKCPDCGIENRGTFPANVTQPSQYGDGVKGLLVYLQNQHYLPCDRGAELIGDLFGRAPSAGTLVNVQTDCATRLASVVQAIKAALGRAAVIGCDETSLRVGKKSHWLHSASTSSATYYATHDKRGRVAMDAIGLLPSFGGTLVHDALASYFHYGQRHGLCNAHLLRELKAIIQQTEQDWAVQMRALLCEVKRAVDDARAQGQSELSPETLAAFSKRYGVVIAAGHEANPLPVQTKSRGRLKRTPAGNLLERMDKHRDAVLLFMHDFQVPFDNNLSERDLRMMKVKLKVSGCFRSVQGAEDFCTIRSYISTLRKQGIPVLDALTSVFRGTPVVPALG